jgi:hypothetical protein
MFNEILKKLKDEKLLHIKCIKEVFPLMNREYSLLDSDAIVARLDDWKNYALEHNFEGIKVFTGNKIDYIKVI